MYWLRFVDPAALALYACLSLVWMLGGVFLAGRLFDLHPRERLGVGISLGFVLWMSVVNLLAACLPLPAAGWVASGLILFTGLAVSLKPLNKRLEIQQINFRGIRGNSARRVAAVRVLFHTYWKQLAILTGLTIFFTLAGRGLGLFDDYQHLPLISIMATGDFPPHFYLNPDTYFAYHYALQVWAATLVRMAGFFPWSAWDLSKGLALALTALLAWLWLVRRTGSRRAGLLGAVVLLLGGGTRWMLPLLPGPVLAWVSRGLTLINTGADTSPELVSALGRAWVIEGGGHFAFPFAFHNGVFVPVTSVLGSTGALPFLTVLLLLLLAERGPVRLAGGAVLAVVLANLALSAEHLYAFLWIGLAVVIAAGLLKKRQHPRQAAGWGIALLGSALLSLVQGGFVTEAARSLVGPLLGFGEGQTSNFYGFSLRWPPAIYSAHLGLLSLAHPAQTLALLFELGPGLLLAPIATWAAWGWLKRGWWLLGGLGFAALINFIFPVFLQYGVDRSITRLPGTALWLWLLLALPALYYLYRRLARSGKILLLAGWACLCLGGLVMLIVQAMNIPYPQYSYFINDQDTHISAEYWNRLEPDARILDTIPYRAVTVFGRPDRAHVSIYVPFPEWQLQAQQLDPGEAARAGYDYIYLDGLRLLQISEEHKARLLQPCVREVAAAGDWIRINRYLLDIRACR